MGLDKYYLYLGLKLYLFKISDATGFNTGLGTYYGYLEKHELLPSFAGFVGLNGISCKLFKLSDLFIIVLDYLHSTN